MLLPDAYQLFLLRPGIRQSDGECRHGEARRHRAVHDGGDDPR